MPTPALLAIDLVAILVLTLAIYFPRHRRRDLVVAFLAVNVGVLAVGAVLATTDAGIGIGLGLFGVLSIIRLRSSEIAQHEVAYYFAALVLGLIGGLAGSVTPMTVALVVAVVAVMAVGDHPRVFARSRQQTMRLDRAIGDDEAAAAHVAALLGVRVHSASVRHVDLVEDTTLVDVRYRARRAGDAAGPERAATAGERVAVSA